MNYLAKNRGAVSVFLLIILVPCLVVASIFVDMGRVQMAQSMGASAADLALNSLLTNYDADLKDWYGMIASCQNIDEFYEVSAEFFLRTVSSQGMSDEEIYLLSDYYAQATSDDTIYDLLMVESQTEKGKIISAVKDANLSNPTLTKDSIIEFMKYRAPIELTSGLITRIKDSNKKGGDGSPSAVEQLLDSDKNSPLVSAKQDYYEAEGELLTAAFYSYLAIRDYYNAASKMGLNNGKLTEYANKINAYRDAYAQIHEITVKNLLNTSGLGQYSRVTIALDKYTYDKESSEIHSGTEEVEETTGSDAQASTEASSEASSEAGTEAPKEKKTIYYIKGSKVTSLLKSLSNAITEYEQAKNNLVNVGSSLMSNLPGEADNEAYAVQWWVQMNNAVNASSGTNYTNVLSAKADTMIKAYAKVNAISDCDEIREAPEGWENTKNELVAKVEGYQKNDLSNPFGASNSYTQMISKLESMYTTYANKINVGNYTLKVDGSTMYLETALSHISLELTHLKEDLEARQKELKIAIYGGKRGDNKVVSLDKLAELAKTYSGNMTTWSNTATNTDTSMGESDKQFIETELVTEQKINTESVSELKSRLCNIYAQMEVLIQAIDSLKYGGSKLLKISDFAQFKKEAQKKVKSADIPLTNAAIKTYADEKFRELYVPTSDNALTMEHTNENAYNPDINPSKDNTVDTPELFVYFHETWSGVNVEEFNDTKAEEEKTADLQKKYEEDEKNKASAYRGGGADPVKEFSQGNAYAPGVSIVTSVVGLIRSIVDGNFDHIRDDIYVTDYIMEMFSYATFDREGMYDLIEDPTTLSLKDDAFKASYDAVRGTDNPSEEKDNDGKWLSTNVKDSYNKTLTNTMINLPNNASYLAEVEYILYGQGTNTENLSKAFGNIYAMRYALNLISCFQIFWNNSQIGAMSNLISAGLGYVIPAPVIKAVLLPILTAIETCRDNTRLAAGFPVEIYKVEEEDWWVWPKTKTSFGSGYGEFFEKLTDGSLFTYENADEGFFYSDYLTLFVYTGLAGGGELEKDMYRRTSEVIQANLNKKLGTTGAESDKMYSMKKAVMYFELNAEIRVKPLMITLPIFDEYDNGIRSATDWCTFKVTATRGYS